MSLTFPDDKGAEEHNNDKNSMSEGEAVDDSAFRSDSEPENEVFWFSKVLPLLSTFQSVSLSFSDTFGTFMAIDEIMIHFFGHSNHTHCMKHKPDMEG